MTYVGCSAIHRSGSRCTSACSCPSCHGATLTRSWASLPPRSAQLEQQVRTEATEYRNRDSGPVIVRYAHYVLDLAAGYRRVVVTYADALDAGASGAEARQLRAAVLAMAAVWRKTRKWRGEWSDELGAPTPPDRVNADG